MAPERKYSVILCFILKFIVDHEPKLVIPPVAYLGENVVDRYLTELMSDGRKS